MAKDEDSGRKAGLRYHDNEHQNFGNLKIRYKSECILNIVCWAKYDIMEIG